MKYRHFRVIATGEWLSVAFTVAGDGQTPNVFSVPAATHQAQIATAYGRLVDTIEVVDADTDVRTGILLAQPLAPPKSPTTQEKAIDAAATEMVEKFGPTATAAEKADRKAAALDLISKAQGR